MKNMKTQHLFPILPVIASVFIAGCTSHKIEIAPTQHEITINPIKVELNINLKIDKEIDDAVKNQQTQSAWQERKPKIDALKAAGTIGEANNGLLAPVPGAALDADAFALITAANADRTTMFKNVADGQNTTPDVVAKRRAARIAEDAPTGTHIQDPDGNWKQKE